MSEITQSWSKSIRFPNLVYDKADVRRIAAIVDAERKKAEECRDDSRKYLVDVDVNYKIDFSGGLAFSSSDPSVFDETDDTLDVHLAQSVSMSLYASRPKKSIQITIEKGERRRNAISISSSDRQWLDYILNRFNEVIGAIRPQSNFIINNLWWLIHIARPIAGYALLSLVGYALDNAVRFGLFTFEPSDKKLPHVLVYIIMFVFSYISGTPIMGFVTDALKDLWPDTEFNFGPDHKNRERMARLRLSVLFSLVIVPLLINLVTK